MGRRSLQSQYAIKAAEDFAKVVGINKNDPRAQAIAVLTKNELAVLRQVIEQNKPIAEAAESVYKSSGKQNATWLLSNPHFTNAFCAWLDARNFNPDQLLDYVINLLHAEAPKFLYNRKTGKHDRVLVPDYVTRVQAAKMLLDRVYYPEKKVRIEQRSLSIKLNGESNINTEDAINRLKLIESRIKELEKEEKLQADGQIVDVDVEEVELLDAPPAPDEAVKVESVQPVVSEAAQPAVAAETAQPAPDDAPPTINNIVTQP